MTDKQLIRVLDIAMVVAAIPAVIWGFFLLTVGLGVTW